VVNIVNTERLNHFVFQNFVAFCNDFLICHFDWFLV
jgi:hypothetical protein